MILSDLSNDILFLITDNLGPKDSISIMTTVSLFDNSLDARIHNLTLTYSCRNEKSVLKWVTVDERKMIFRSLSEREVAVRKQLQNTCHISSHIILHTIKISSIEASYIAHIYAPSCMTHTLELVFSFQPAIGGPC